MTYKAGRDRLLVMTVAFPLMMVGVWSAGTFAIFVLSGATGSKASQGDMNYLRDVPFFNTILGIAIVIVPLVGLAVTLALAVKEHSDIEIWKRLRSYAIFTIVCGLIVIATLWGVGSASHWQFPTTGLITTVAALGGLYSLFYLIYGVMRTMKQMRLVSPGENL